MKKVKITPSPKNGRQRVLIEDVGPRIDAGLHPIKRILHDTVVVEADLVADGHDELCGVVRYRHEGERRWCETPLTLLGNDRWQARFSLEKLGRYLYTVQAWVDGFATWRRHLIRRVEAGQDVRVELLIGAELVGEAAARAGKAFARELQDLASALADQERSPQDRATLATGDLLASLMAGHPNREHATTYPRELAVVVDRERARFSAWYELFPRSCASQPGQHGTLRDCAARLAYVAEMGFDVVYLPPIHPIGSAHRKGQNNTTSAQHNDFGSPWAIGSPDGGHTAVHPRLGTLDDLRDLVAKAREYGMELALDIAFQCSPDHPWVQEHPSWFRRRPDGTVQYAENPPKKYQDIYPLDFESDAWPELWQALRGVFAFWAEQGVRIFRVDNPHTKPLAFWQWMIADLKKTDPDLIFLAEAFTRPKVMYALAKIGFTQSYTYFTWRNSRDELAGYLSELTKTEVHEYFRPNLWPNTPDILHASLQHGGRPAFISRLILAATLGANYGIYGPAFELCINTPREPGSEEYLDSEKYQLRRWDLNAPESLRPLLCKVNAIRRGNRALQSNASLHFHGCDNDQILCFSKRSIEENNRIITVVNLDSHHRHSGWVHLDLAALGLHHDQTYGVEDLLTGVTYQWRGAHNYVDLDPWTLPAHILLVHG